MSLINNMLNDLEENKQDDQARKEALSGVVPTVKKHKEISDLVSKKFIMMALAAIALIVMIVVVLSNYSKIITGLTSAFESHVSVEKEAVNKSVTPMLPEVKLQNIVLKQKDKQTNLDFMLSAPTQYYIDHASENQLSITLSNVTLLGNLPISLENTFITSFSTKQNKNDVVVTLDLLPGTKIDELQLFDKPESYLHLSFLNVQVVSAATAKLKEPTPVPIEQQESDRYQEILELLAKNKLQDVVYKLHIFIWDFPDNMQAREILVSLLIREGRLQKAEEILMFGLNKYQSYIPFIKLRAYILAKQNKTSEAIDFLQESGNNFGVDDVEYLSLLAALYQQKGDYMQAAGLYNQLTKIQPQKALWWVGLGIGLENAGQSNAAKEAYRKAGNVSDVPPALASFLNGKI